MFITKRSMPSNSISDQRENFQQNVKEAGLLGSNDQTV